MQDLTTCLIKMFVIHSTRKGFVHIPRTGGAFVESQCAFIDGYESLHPYHGDIPASLAHYEWHTVVRDPVERFVSLFRANQKNKRLSTHNGNFTTFIDHVWNGFEMHTRPQVSWISEQTNCHINVVDCITALGGKITGEKINQSQGNIPLISQAHKIKIKQIYSQDVDLFSKLKSLQDD